MSLSHLGEAALGKAISTSAEMTTIAVTPDEKKLAAGVAAIVAKVKAVATAQAKAGGAGNTRTPSPQEMKAMQEAQMSFSLQYLQIQSQRQSENRSYTAVSNIMKTKHDTVKNSISNIR